MKKSAVAEVGQIQGIPEACFGCWMQIDLQLNSNLI